MRSRLNIHIILITTICLTLPCPATEIPNPNDPNRYLIHTHEPVKWIDPDGTKWILSNLASQQNLFRTLDGLTKTTGDPKYKQAAMDAMKYAFANLRSPDGLFYWGNCTAFDVRGDEVFGWRLGTGYAHCLKANYPYYNLMWEVDPNATKQFIEVFWSAHILDWSNLDMNRWSNYGEIIGHVWEHEYKGGPVFFESGSGGSFQNAGTDLICAAAWLSKLSGEKEPIVWAKRLAHRYVRTRHPRTGISYGMYTEPKWTAHESYDDVMRKLVPGTVDFLPSDFPWAQYTNPLFREATHGQFMPAPGIFVHKLVFYWQSQFLVGELLGGEGDEFKQWALEELTAYGKASYRKTDNAYVPILTDGTSLEGYVVKADGPLGPKGVTLEPLPARPSDYWAYSMAYRVTKDEFMWEMARSIAKGNAFGDIGATAKEEPRLNLDTDCPDPYAILAFLELHRATGKNGFLQIAQKIGNNILRIRFHNGFFLASNKHIYTKFDAIDSLALLHLHTALMAGTVAIPQAWPSLPYLVCPYRWKDPTIDNTILYMRTESSDPPISLSEAATTGRLDIVKSLIAKGADIDKKEGSLFRTPLHRAVMSGHSDVAECLLAHGANPELRDSSSQTPLDLAVGRGRKDIVELLQAKVADSSIHGAARLGVLDKVKAFVENGTDINAKDGQGMTPLHLAAQKGQREVVEFLILRGADVHAKDNQGRTPLDLALSKRRNDVVTLLAEAGADIPSIHVAAFVGSLEKLRSLIETGTDVDAKDEDGRTPLLRAIKGRHIDAVKFLIEGGADVNRRDEQGYVPLVHALWSLDSDMVTLLLDKGADVRAKDTSGYTPLHWAVMMGSTELTELMLDAGAEANAESNTGQTPLDLAQQGSHEIAELLRKHMLPEERRQIESTVPDMIFDGEPGSLFGCRIACGDIDGDSYDDIIIGAGKYNNYQGRVYLFYGGPDMDAVPDLIFESQQQGDNFALVSCGDIDNDGYEDIVIVACGYKENQGRAYLYWGATREFMNTDPDKIFEGEAEESAWFGLSHPGPLIYDIDHDGYRDILFGTFRYPGNGIGRAYLYYGNSKELMDTSYDLIFTGENPKDQFGVSIGCGDVDNDGYGDIIIGARSYPGGNPSQGRAYLYYGGKQGNMDATADLIFEAESKDRHYFGQDIICVDQNKDGYDDILIGAQGYKERHGRVYLFEGDTRQNQDTIPDTIFDGEAAKGDYGFAILCGDIDGDHDNDVVIGADAFRQKVGRVYVYWGRELSDPSPQPGRIFTGEHPEEWFSQMMACGDVNNDGYDDLIIGAGGYKGGAEQGRAYLYYGGPRD
ncbi:MAG: ankyrin repeat domain-containing protein [Planctomycetota bacterium]|jgi:pectate lyase